MTDIIVGGRECVEIILPTSKNKVVIKKRLNHGENIQVKKIMFDGIKLDTVKAKEGEKSIKNQDDYVISTTKNDRVIILCIDNVNGDKPTIEWLNNLYEEDVKAIDDAIVENSKKIEDTKKK